MGERWRRISYKRHLAIKKPMANGLRQERGGGGGSGETASRERILGNRSMGSLPRNTEEAAVNQPHRGTQERIEGRFAGAAKETAINQPLLSSGENGGDTLDLDT